MGNERSAYTLLWSRFVPTTLVSSLHCSPTPLCRFIIFFFSFSTKKSSGVSWLLLYVRQGSTRIFENEATCTKNFWNIFFYILILFLLKKFLVSFGRIKFQENFDIKITCVEGTEPRNFIFEKYLHFKTLFLFVFI